MRDDHKVVKDVNRREVHCVTKGWVYYLKTEGERRGGGTPFGFGFL